VKRSTFFGQKMKRMLQAPRRLVPADKPRSAPTTRLKKPMPFGAGCANFGSFGWNTPEPSRYGVACVIKESHPGALHLIRSASETGTVVGCCCADPTAHQSNTKIIEAAAQRSLLRIMNPGFPSRMYGFSF